MRTHCGLSAGLVMGPGVTHLAQLNKVPQHVLGRVLLHGPAVRQRPRLLAGDRDPLLGLVPGPAEVVGVADPRPEPHRRHVAVHHVEGRARRERDAAFGLAARRAADTVSLQRGSYRSTVNWSKTAEAREAGRKGGMASHRRRKEMMDQGDTSGSPMGATETTERAGGDEENEQIR